MGATVTDSARYQIIALLNSGKSNYQIAKVVGVSASYVDRFSHVYEMVRCEQWDKLIGFSSLYSVPESLLSFIHNFVSAINGRGVPNDVRQQVLQAQVERRKPKEPEPPKPEPPKPEPPEPEAPEDNTAAAMVKILAQLNSISQILKEGADDICQTGVTSRKLLEQKIDNNFDVLCQTIRDGFESVKTTIRKVNKQ